MENPHALRALVLVTAVALVSCRKKDKPLENVDPATPTFEPPPAWLPLDGPPGGRKPCERGDAGNALEAARTCFTSRVRPALFAVAKTRRLGDLEVGLREHMERHLATEPHLSCAEAAPGEEHPQWSDEPKRTVLGNAALVSTARRYHHCTLSASAPGTNIDGGYYLGLYVDETSLETVYVYHPLCC